MVAAAPKYEFGVVISGTKTPLSDWVRAGIWRGLAPIAMGQEDLCVLPASFYGFYVMMRGGSLLKTGMCVWRAI